MSTQEIDPLSVKRSLGLILLSTALVLIPSIITSKRITVEVPKPSISLGRIEPTANATSFQDLLVGDPYRSESPKCDIMGVWNVTNQDANRNGSKYTYGRLTVDQHVVTLDKNVGNTFTGVYNEQDATTILEANGGLVIKDMHTLSVTKELSQNIEQLWKTSLGEDLSQENLSTIKMVREMTTDQITSSCGLEPSDMANVQSTSLAPIAENPTPDPPPVEKPATVAPVQPEAPAIVGNKLDWLSASNIPRKDWELADWLIKRESSWNPNAQNPRSTAYGLKQFLDGTWAGVGCEKALAINNPVYQLNCGQKYVMARYGSWEAANAFWRVHKWY